MGYPVSVAEPDGSAVQDGTLILATGDRSAPINQRDQVQWLRHLIMRANRLWAELSVLTPELSDAREVIYAARFDMECPTCQERGPHVIIEHWSPQHSELELWRQCLMLPLAAESCARHDALEREVQLVFIALDADKDHDADGGVLDGVTIH